MITNTTDRMYGYDISHHNSPTILSNVTKRDFVVIKATEGIGYVDSEFRNNVIRAKQVGYKIIGAYHFVRADIVTNTPEKEVQDFVSALLSSDGEFSFVAIDVEGKSLSVITIINYCKEMIVKLRALVGVPILIYISASQAEKFQGLCDVVDDCYLWVADWSSKTLEISAKKHLYDLKYVAMHQTGSGELGVDYNYADSKFLKMADDSPTLDGSYGDEDKLQTISDMLDSIMDDVYTIKAILKEIK